MTACERIVSALEAKGHSVKGLGTNKMQAQCPAHEDRAPSLSLTKIEGQALVHCHAGCETEDVLSALGLTMGDLFDESHGARYDYTDRIGTVVRTVSRSPQKKFIQSGDTKGKPTLYRLPTILEAVEIGVPVYLVEGEKDVHALESVGAVATTAPMGANNIDKADLTPLHNAIVIAIVDDDDAGQKWAEKVHDKLDGRTKSLTFAQSVAGKDAADHIAAGHGLGDFVPLELETDVPLRRARITWAIEIEPEPVIWAWEESEQGRIPAGSLCIAAGREGTGKSSFGIWKAAHITRGTLPGAYFGTPRRVFYVAVEDSWKHTLVPRLMAAGADLSMVARVDVATIEGDDMTLSLPHDNKLLEKAIKEHGVALVVMDPIMSLIGEKIDTHRERDVRSALDPLAKMADRTGSIFLGIAHFNKGGGTDAASLITGSGAFKNVPRSVFGFARDDTDESNTRVMSQVKNSLGRDDLPSLSYIIESVDVPTKKGVAVTGKFTFTGQSDRSVADVLRDSRGGDDEREERSEAASWLTDYIGSQGGSCSAGDALKAAAMVGIAKTTLTRARKSAGVRSAKAGMSGGWIWTIEESTEGTEGSTVWSPDSSVSSVVPSDDREPCPTCDRAMGKADAALGQCIQCRRITAANEKVQVAS